MKSKAVLLFCTKQASLCKKAKRKVVFEIQFCLFIFLTFNWFLLLDSSSLVVSSSGKTSTEPLESKLSSRIEHLNDQLDRTTPLTH